MPNGSRPRPLTAPAGRLPSRGAGSPAGGGPGTASSLLSPPGRGPCPGRYSPRSRARPSRFTTLAQRPDRIEPPKAPVPHRPRGGLRGSRRVGQRRVVDLRLAVRPGGAAGDEDAGPIRADRDPRGLGEPRHGPGVEPGPALGAGRAVISHRRISGGPAGGTVG